MHLYNSPLKQAPSFPFQRRGVICKRLSHFSEVVQPERGGSRWLKSSLFIPFPSTYLSLNLSSSVISSVNIISLFSSSPTFCSLAQLVAVTCYHSTVSYLWWLISQVQALQAYIAVGHMVAQIRGSDRILYISVNFNWRFRKQFVIAWNFLMHPYLIYVIRIPLFPYWPTSNCVCVCVCVLRRSLALSPRLECNGVISTPTTSTSQIQTTLLSQPPK